MIRINRLPLLLLALLSLLAGITAGLSRLGFSIPTGLSPHHGAIMTGGFIGTLIILEKIIPIKKTLLFIFPILSGTSTLLFYFEFPLGAYVLLIGASMGLVITLSYYLLKHKTLVYVLMVLGAFNWFIGNVVLFKTYSYPTASPWWIAFALFIICSERIELMKFLPVTRNQHYVLVALLLLFMTSNLLSFHSDGSIIRGSFLIVISIWLLKFDVINIGIHKKGLTRYTSVALLTGYVALMLTGLFMVFLSHQPFGYDMVLHLFFIGFIFSMIFAHGPIILPCVLGILSKPYNKILYAWLALLHCSLIIRIIGDTLLIADLRKFSGILTTIAIVLYFITLGTLLKNSLSPDAKVH